MKRFTLKTFRGIALTMFSLTLLSTNGYCNTPQQIFFWVARQMNIENVNNMPVINYVDKAKLQQVFQGFSLKSYTQIESDLGRDHAEEIMGSYMDNIVGLFHPETQAIYIGAFLNPCRQKSVLAHEFTHYYQDVKRGRIHPHDYAADYKRSRRELEAYEIQRKFEQVFCK